MMKKQKNLNAKSKMQKELVERIISKRQLPNNIQNSINLLNNNKIYVQLKGL